ncbi:MAG: hypothetical protein QF363_14440 [Planctomycetaceae bacterium]|nr:hypothetical protein [Planctomycetaceae bacterium]
MFSSRNWFPAAKQPGSWFVSPGRCFVLLLLLLPLLAGTPGRANGQTRSSGQLELFRKQHEKLRKDYLAALTKLKTWCTDHDLDKASGTVEAVIRSAVPAEGGDLRLPTTVSPDLSPDLSADQRHWQSQLRTLRRNHGRALYLLSRRVLKTGQTSYAYDLVRETATSDPDSRSARRLLGFVRFGNEWTTPFAASQKRRRFTWHKDFGWLPASHVQRYEQGQRYFKRQWVSLAREKELRRDFRNAWEVRTDHYLVRTNHSLERGVSLAVDLETFHRFFHRSFAGFFNTPDQIKQLFEGRRSRGRSTTTPRPHVVHFFRDRDEYRRTLRPRIAQIDITNGLYMTDDRIVYFFHGNEPPDRDYPRATLFHEATHQLFYGSRPKQRPIARSEHFWIVEGIACYMESFLPTGRGYHIGNPRYLRFYWARQRLLEENYYIPLQKFAAMGMRAFQNDPNITRNYSQASGLAHFFLHYDGGRYRDSLIRHLMQIYTPGQRIEVRSLESLTGVDAAELDRQYRRHLADQQSRLSTAPRRTPRQ